MFEKQSYKAGCCCFALLICQLFISSTGAAEPNHTLIPVNEPSTLYVSDPNNEQIFLGFPENVSYSQSPCWPRWFASATGLVMTRSLASNTIFTGPGGVSIDTANASASWPGGVDLRIGRWFGDRQEHAFEMVYWGVYNIGSTFSDSTPTTSGLLQRSDLINDVEVNWLYSLGERPEFLSQNRKTNLMWLAGFRFFQLEDTLAFESGTTSLDIATNNNLYGAQVGARFDWKLAPRWRFSAVPKFLLAGNAVTNTSTLNTTSIFSDLGVFSWLGSIDTSINWDFSERWTLWMGYRVVGVGNISQADQQWPNTVPTTIDQLSGITVGSESIVHGGFAGFEKRY